MRDQAILNTHPNVVEIINGEDYFDKNHNLVTLDEAKVNTELTKLQTAYDSNQYQRNRAVEYPSIKDQLDDLYHNGIDGWKATIKTTKDKYPKG
tara:strand:- start:471 stop:752 length:282 start_codon:yes stop_codon:yes gene_type:complete